MPLTPEIAAEVLATCQKNAQEAAEALSRALDQAITISAESSEPISLEQPPESWQAGGLIVLLKLGSEAALLMLPEASGMLPTWYRTPDATGKSKLTTLAQELGMILLPDALMPDDFSAQAVSHLLEAAKRGGVVAGNSAITFKFQAGENQAPAWLVWPATQPAALFEESAPSPTPAANTPSKPEITKAPAANAEVSEEEFEEALANLPPYVRSLLKIQVTAGVTLATTQLPVQRILNLGAGSIIQFDRNCDQPFILQIGKQAVAEGEAVKVGDKFGFRVTNMIMPGERFFPLPGKRGIRKAS